MGRCMLFKPYVAAYNKLSVQDPAGLRAELWAHEHFYYNRAHKSVECKEDV